MAWEYNAGSQFRATGLPTAGNGIDAETPIIQRCKVVGVAAKAFSAIAAGSLVDVRVLLNGVEDTNFRLSFTNAIGTGRVWKGARRSGILVPGDYVTLRFIETGGSVSPATPISATLLFDNSPN